MPVGGDGRTPSGLDVLAGLVVAQGMGAESFGLEGDPEDVDEQLRRLAPSAAIPLPQLAEGEHEKIDFEVLAANATDAFLIDPTINVSPVVACGPNFAEDLITAEEYAGAVHIVIRDDVDLDVFAENQYMIRSPLCLGADSAQLLEAALSVYDGRAFYDGGDSVDFLELCRFRREYGLIVL
jgi:5-methyltetrahydrofolate--homocysteine methyltransferase